MITDSKRRLSTPRVSKKKDSQVLQVQSDKEPSNVSVITKTTTPKVVVQSEKVNEDILNGINSRHLILKLICFVIMCIILLMTFFLSLRTYNTVNELSDYVQGTFQP